MDDIADDLQDQVPVALARGGYRHLVRFFVVSRMLPERYIGPVHLAYNPPYLACFFSRNSIFLSQKISQQYFPADL
jgi:hypothetical protein